MKFEQPIPAASETAPERQESVTMPDIILPDQGKFAGDTDVAFLRESKRVTMENLRQRLKDIEAHEDFDERERGWRRIVSYDAGSEKLFEIAKDGSHRNVTLGQLVSDSLWEI